MSEPKLNIKEETSAKKTRSPPKKAKVEQSVPKKKKLKTDADKAAEKAQHLRFGKAELTPDELSRLSKAQKREMYAAHAARSAAHHEVDQYEDDNVGTQALSEGEKAAGNVRDISKSRYARKLKRKAKMQGKKGARNAKSSVQKPTAAQDTGASGTGEGGSNWLSRWRQKQDIRQSYYAAARSGTAAQTAGGKAASNGASAARSGVEQAVEKGKTAVSTAVKGLVNAAKGNAHVLVIVGVFLLLVLMVMSGFSSCGILFSGGTQVSGQTIYSAEDRDIWGAEQDYKKLEKELDKKIKRTPTDHPGYNEYQYHLDPIEHDPWQLTSFLTTLYLRENGAGVGFATYNKVTGEPLESGQISEKNLPPDGQNTIPAARNWYLFELSDDDRKAIQQESVKILENIPQAGIGRRRIWEPETLPKDIRLINSHYDDLYRIPDGGVVQVDYPDGRSFTARLEHLDDYHFDMGGLGNVFHICQFAEVMERNHADFYPEIQTQDEQAAWELGGKGYLAIQSCEDGWDYTLYHSDYSVMDGGQLDAPELTIQEAREQILEAHHMEKGRRLLQDYDAVMDKVAEAEELSADHRPSTLEKLAELASDTSAPKSSARSAPEL